MYESRQNGLAENSNKDITDPGFFNLNICSISVCKFIGTQLGPNSQALLDCTVDSTPIKLVDLVNELEVCIPFESFSGSPCTVQDFDTSGAFD